MKKEKLQIVKTEGITDYWFYFVRLKQLEGWNFYNYPDYIKTYLYKDDKIITYDNFTLSLRIYYKEVSTLVIKGHTLRFDFGLGNLRIVKTDRNVEEISRVGRHIMLDIKNVHTCFYFCKDEVDAERRKRFHIVKSENNKFTLHIARSNERTDKTLSFKARLRKIIDKNPAITELYDLKKYNDNKI